MFDMPLDARNMFGIMITVLGVFMYSYIKMKQ